MRTITLELLRHGPAHNQLLSRLTNYLALCGNHGAQTVHMPFDHNQLLHRLHALEYQSDERSRQFQLEDTAQTIGGVLGEVAGLTAELSRSRETEDAVLHLRLVISASELALVPFELADAPHGFPGAGQPLLLQNQLPLCITREVRRAADARFEWPRRPKILFVVAQPPGFGEVPLEAHLLALRQVLEPWINGYDDPAARQAQVSSFLTVLPEATIDQVQQACATENFTHIHILAHGIRYLDGEDYRFGLAFHPRDAADPCDIISGSRLATVLRAVHEPAWRQLGCPAVVTLACCDSGNVGSVAGAGSSVAHALHGAGIPIVVASQFPLTFAGSVLMVEILYKGFVHGLDPRSVLNNLRRQLRAREPRSHDWASIVAYASLPPDFDRQLPNVQIEQARAAINGVLEEADRHVLELSSWWQTKRGPKKPPTTTTAPNKTADKSLKDYQRKIGDAERKLQSVLEAAPHHAADIYGLLAGTKKREAYILHCLSSLEHSASPSRRAEECVAALVQSLAYYTSCLAALPNGSWPLHQVLSLALTLGDQRHRHGELWLEAVSLGLTTLRYDPSEKSALAHTDLLELYLLACDTSRWNSGALVTQCLLGLHPELGLKDASMIASDRAAFHARELIRKKGAESFAVRTTVRQIVRYHEWFTHVSGSLLGGVGGDAERLLDILDP